MILRWVIELVERQAAEIAAAIDDADSIWVDVDASRLGDSWIVSPPPG